MKDTQELYTKFSKEYGADRMDTDYLSIIGSNINPNSVILDAGCGNGGVFAKSKLNVKDKRKKLIGIDAGINNNPCLDEAFIGNLEKLPFGDEAFDMVVCEWVAEHLQNPCAVFSEFSRVLKKGGLLVIFTPNVLNPLVFIGRLVSSNTKDKLLKKFLDFEEKDLFPVFLRCNTVFGINKIAQTAGLKREFLKTYSNPEYFRFSKPLFTLSVLLSGMLAKLKFLDFSRVYILSSYRKLN